MRELKCLFEIYEIDHDSERAIDIYQNLIFQML